MSHQEMRQWRGFTQRCDDHLVDIIVFRWPWWVLGRRWSSWMERICKNVWNCRYGVARENQRQLRKSPNLAVGLDTPHMKYGFETNLNHALGPAEKQPLRAASFVHRALDGR